MISLECCHHSWRRLSFTSLIWVAQCLGGLSFVHSGEEQIMTGILFLMRDTFHVSNICHLGSPFEESEVWCGGLNEN